MEWKLNNSLKQLQATDQMVQKRILLTQDNSFAENNQFPTDILLRYVRIGTLPMTETL